ncbi:MFS transporter [Nocardia mexicana]|uniref:EmrB/QacA subfamily drug resistance transporter n=1 Tax=Nocardia mexicana TaxID=279262 RepID=A0A370GEA1_9NOCA|nr:MFS transporter [Nocardia mexicana]RDI42122.1 EmrB/QacA subfamily drug resistance transporter [Nocardia mexicana]
MLETRSTPTRTAAAPPAEPAPYPARWRVLPVVLSAIFMAMFDWFVVNVAASSLQTDLHAGEAALELIVGGYGFAFASGLITGGRLGDLHGHRRLFAIGMLAFAAASLLCGLAPTAWALVVFRILQGATAALMVPQMLALINTMFPVSERPRAMAAYGATIGTGAVAGQVLGGVLLDADLFGWGWRTIFYINVPVGLAAAALAARWLPAHERNQRPKLDPVGALGISAALALLLVPITVGRPEGWPLWTWISMVASAPVMALTLRYERLLARRGGQPVLDMSMVRERVFRSGLVISGGYLTFFAGFMLCLTLLLQNGLGLSPLPAGLAFAPLGLCFAASSFFLSRRVADRIGNRVMVAGTLTSLVGLALTFAVLTWFGSDLSPWALVPGMMIVGIGNGLTIPSAIGAVLSSGIPPQQAGMAAGVLTTSQQFGNAIGATVLGTIFFSALGSASGTGDYVTAMQAAALAGFLVLAIVLAAAFTLPRQTTR